MSHQLHSLAGAHQGDRHRACVAFAILAAALGLGPLAWSVQSGSPEVFDEEGSGYKSTRASGVAEALNARLERGEAVLRHDARHGYLPALLRELKVLESSQLLVASKTSPNRHFISPKNPRALYFNESASVAYVPGAPLLEVTATDPQLGIVFYTLDQRMTERPRLVRNDRCLECHASAKTLDVPGLLVRSFHTGDDGDVDLLSGRMVTHRTPIADRWGGYYVTGTHGAQSHLGNWFPAPGHTTDPPHDNGNLARLDATLDLAKFPAPGSDIVALLVLDHQVHMQNLLTRLAFEARSATRANAGSKSLQPAVEAVLRYLLFVDEVRLNAPVQGSSPFAREFEQLGPRDRQGRSLRQFDLQTRTFQHPCSFMVYSASFDALPESARKPLLRRLWAVLSGKDTSPDFASITPAQRQAIREILVETKPDLPVTWRLGSD